ncbi:MAG: hypothetical protein COA88_09130 [Kordia sp.]|nr:MAG: hypothetical protein COA88_09130 [Kordia sp.]
MDSLNFSLINIISFLALFAALLFAFQVYFFKNKNKANIFFATYLINIAVIIVFFLVLNLKQMKWAYIILPFLMLACLSLGPILWIYVRLVVGEKGENLFKHFYLPIFFSGVVLILLILTQCSLGKTGDFYIMKGLYVIVMIGLTIVFLTQNIFYIYKTFKLYKIHRDSIGDSYSYTEKINLSWFRLLIYGYIIFIIGLIITNLIDDSWSYIVFYLILLSYVVFSGYNALNQEPVFKQERIAVKDEKTSSLKLTDVFLIELEKRLLLIMKEEQLFLDSTLTIFSLAKEMNTNTKYLSFLINKSLQKNFVLFVNEYRVTLAKKMLLDPNNDKLTIEYIGSNAGFKSKSAFNAAFKKNTGTTPSVFKANN